VRHRAGRDRQIEQDEQVGEPQAPADRSRVVDRLLEVVEVVGLLEENLWVARCSRRRASRSVRRRDRVGSFAVAALPFGGLSGFSPKVSAPRRGSPAIRDRSVLHQAPAPSSERAGGWHTHFFDISLRKVRTACSIGFRIDDARDFPTPNVCT
jgi:hypothetical protein